MSDENDAGRGRFEPPRTLAFTRTGKFFVLMTLGVGFGAINTGNNLLFLLLGMMLSLIVASGLLSEAVVRRLDVDRSAPFRPLAGRSSPGKFRVDNPKRWASLSIEVAEARTVCRAGPLAGEALTPARVPWWKFWVSADEAEDGREPVARRYCPRLEAEDARELTVRYRFPARGAYQLQRIEVSTRFPFSLFEKAREVDAREQIVVLPRPRPAPAWRTRLMAAFGDTPAGERGQGQEYYGLREYRPGEDKRLIHWRRTAARGEPVVREQEREEHRRVDVVLANTTPEGTSPDEVRGEFERALERTAGLLDELAAAGMRARLHVLDTDGSRRSATDEDARLAELARVPLLSGAETRTIGGDRPSAQAGRVLVAFPDVASRTPGDWDLTFEIGDDASQEVDRG
ncbi:MAG: DUF58 domain-containing protein [Bradymonadaceae bacterium]